MGNVVMPDDFVIPGSPDWFEARRGIPTGSRASDIMARLAPKYRVKRWGVSGEEIICSTRTTVTAAQKDVDKHAKAGRGAWIEVYNGDKAADWYAYLVEKLGERLTGRAEDHFETAAMRAGVENEPKALARYMSITGNIVEPTRWVGVSDPFGMPRWGATPDGFVMGAPVIVSIKCPITHNYVRARLNGEIEPQHYWQAIAELTALPEMERVDLALFDPWMPSYNDQIWIRRIYREEHQAAIDLFTAALDEFIDALDSAHAAWRSDGEIAGILLPDFVRRRVVAETEEEDAEHGD